VPLFIHYEYHLNSTITARASIADLPFALLCRIFIDGTRAWNSGCWKRPV